MNSIISQNPQTCYLCGRNNASDRHHVFEGSNRQMSERYGLTVRLCRDCHRWIHDNPQAEGAVMLKQYVQRKAMHVYGWNIDEWISKFGKNYL